MLPLWLLAAPLTPPFFQHSQFGCPTCSNSCITGHLGIFLLQCLLKSFTFINWIACFYYWFMEVFKRNSSGEFLVYFLHVYGVPIYFSNMFFNWGTSLLFLICCKLSSWVEFLRRVCNSPSWFSLELRPHFQLVWQSPIFCVFSSTSKTSGLYLKSLISDWPVEKLQIPQVKGEKYAELMSAYFPPLQNFDSSNSTFQCWYPAFKRLLSIFDPGL